MGGIRAKLNNPAMLIVIVLLVILAPILKPGFFSVHDETHIVDVYQMYRSLEAGGFPPRFAPDVNFGIGYPYFNFYYHLPFYVTSFFHFLGFSFVDSFKYMMGLAVVMAAAGFYLFLRNHVGKISATIGTLIYLLSPYFAVDLYVRGAFGELFIFALLPWAGFFLNNYLTRSSFTNLSFASLAIALLALSHNVLHPFTFSILFFYGLTNLVILKERPRNYIKIIWPFFIGLGLAAYYLLPALLEINFISSYEQFNIADHFPFIKQLLIPYWGYGVSIWGPLDDISFNIGIVNLLLLLASVFIFKILSREKKILLIFFWLVCLIALILTNNRTLFFWESLKFLRLVQFPWRMLLFLTISTSIIGGLVAEAVLARYKNKAGPVFILVILALLLILNIWHYHPSEYKNTTDEEYLELYFANRTLEGNGVRSNLSPDYLNFSEDFIPPTIWQSQRPGRILDEVKLASGSGTVSFEKKGLNYEIAYQISQDDTVVVSKAYFPGWKASFPGWVAKSNSATLKLEPYSEYGIIGISVPKGEGKFNLSFQNTPVRVLANSISAVSGLLVLVLLIYPVFKKNKND